MDVDKAIQEANERERREWAVVRWGCKILYAAGVLYLVWQLVASDWRNFSHAWQAMFC
jgi:hypothetical protein